MFSRYLREKKIEGTLYLIELIKIENVFHSNAFRINYTIILLAEGLLHKSAY